MKPQIDPVIHRMQVLIDRWQKLADRRALFLRCYQMMTSNTLDAIEQGQFHDPRWVDRLLHRFADYYFEALAVYERDPQLAPAVWQVAFYATLDPRSRAIQQLLLGVNAHINYDLVLTLVDVMHEEWPQASPQQRARRYADHRQVNEIIAATIDAVQDEVLEPSMPVMEVVDRLFGRVDELMLSRLLTGWREEVWRNAVQLIEAGDAPVSRHIQRRIERAALRTGELISLRPPGSTFPGFRGVRPLDM